LIDESGSADCAFMKHPECQSVVEELNYLTDFVASGDEYLRVLYENEAMKAQVYSYIKTIFLPTIFHF
jgi:hypothetical protein